MSMYKISNKDHKSIITEYNPIKHKKNLSTSLSQNMWT